MADLVVGGSGARVVGGKQQCPLAVFFLTQRVRRVHGQAFSQCPVAPRGRALPKKRFERAQRRHRLTWCGVVWWCGVAWRGVVWCGVAWRGVVWCGVVWCCVVWCGVVWCGVVW